MKEEKCELSKYGHYSDDSAWKKKNVSENEQLDNKKGQSSNCESQRGPLSSFLHINMEVLLLLDTLESTPRKGYFPYNFPLVSAICVSRHNVWIFRVLFRTTSAITFCTIESAAFEKIVIKHLSIWRDL